MDSSKQTGRLNGPYKQIVQTTKQICDEESPSNDAKSASHPNYANKQITTMVR